MRKVGAQEFELVRREIRDQETAACAHGARRLDNRGPGIIEKVQDLVKDDRIEAGKRPAVRKRKPIDIGKADLGVANLAARKPVARDRKHLGTCVHADRAARIGGEQLQHPARTGAGIEKVLDSGAAEIAQDRGFDIFFGRVQRADLLPLRGIRFEERGRFGGARLTHLCKALRIGVVRSGVGLRGVRDRLSQLGAHAALIGAVEGPASFFEPLDQSGFGQKLQMARDPGLALADNLRELAHCELGLEEDQQKPKPSGVPRGAEHGDEPVHDPYKHIFICEFKPELRRLGLLFPGVASRIERQQRARGRDGSMQTLHKLAMAAVFGLLLCGCATRPTPEALAANDPYEVTNRQTFKFNAKLDKYFVIPTVGAYIYVVPEWGRTRVHDLLDNLSLPVTFANDLMQGQAKLGSQTFGRFLVNATMGLGGLFDPATKLRIPNHSNDFGVTLGVWGIPEGPYEVLPLLGPNNPRDTTGFVADYFIDPLHWLHYKQHIWWDVGHEYMSLLDLRSQTYQTVQGVQRSSLDFYSSMRSLYRQLRNNEIRRARPQTQELPKF